MKIGIATIYKCYNCGSFFQAYGLQKYLSDLGHRVELIPLDAAYNKKYRLRRQLGRDLARDWFSLRLMADYWRDWKLYAVGSDKSEAFDLVISGSDEIWSIKNKTFLPAPEYYGLDLACDRVVSYASCVGRSTLEDFQNETGKRALEGICQMDRISARDDATQRFLTQLLPGREIPRVMDPSFLIDWKGLETPCPLEDFILVYTYDGDWGFSRERIDAAKAFAYDVRLPLVSVGFRNEWCDRWIPGGPRAFLGYLRNASYVLTDTFHGCAMSIQYGKQFVCMGEGKSKVDSLLAELNLTCRVYRGNRPVSRIIGEEIDYGQVDSIVAAKVQDSRQYLADCLSL